MSAVLEVFPELIFTVKDILRPTLLTTLVSLVTKQQLEVSFLFEFFDSVVLLCETVRVDYIGSPWTLASIFSSKNSDTILYEWFVQCLVYVCCCPQVSQITR